MLERFRNRQHSVQAKNCFLKEMQLSIMSGVNITPVISWINTINRDFGHMSALINSRYSSSHGNCFIEPVFQCLRIYTIRMDSSCRKEVGRWD